MKYKREENCFLWLEDFQEAQSLMDEQLRFAWAQALQLIGSKINPVHQDIFHRYPVDYYWSVHQSEWATDVLFTCSRALSQIYPQLVRAGIATFSSPDVMRFLGKKLHGNFSKYSSNPLSI